MPEQQQSATPRGYKQGMAFDFAWKAGIGAIVAYLLSLPIAFQALVAFAVAATVAWALIELAVMEP